MQRGHIFLSPLGFGITFLISIGLGFSFWRDGGRMFSPGALTAQNRENLTLSGFSSHASFESQCEHCHRPFESTQADLCLRCHETVTKQIVEQVGTHGVIENIQDCRGCHPDHKGRDYNPTVAAYTLFDHAVTRFSLIWHQVDYDTTLMECLDCHTSENAFKLTPGVCQSCHTEHAPAFMENHLQDFGEDCLACHNGSGEITHFEHGNTRFPLEGMHTQIDCVACHTNGKFSNLSLTCDGCHTEPEIHFGLFSQDCVACHTANGWSALAGMNGQSFEHFEQSGFSLNRHITGYANEIIPCSDCHIRQDGFKVGFDLGFCVDCHEKAEPVFFQGHQELFGLDCLACHDGVDRLSDFNHDHFFKLDGQHAVVSCDACHLSRVFSGTPSDCVSCHQEPEIHIGSFGVTCQNCHSTTAWWPARMTSHNFPIDHGDQGLTACDVCHTGSYTAYNCYGCHEHQPDEVLEEHLDEGISRPELTNCVDCHPDGLEHDD